MSHSACALAHLGLQRPDSVLRLQGSELVFSKRKLRQAEIIQLVREKRERETQTLGVFIAPVCPLWAAGQAAESRLSAPRTPQWAVSAASHWASDVWSTVGQDRLVPLSLATLDAQQQRQAITFRGAEMLDTFGLPQGGSQYRRLIAGFQRVFGATIFFGTDTQREKAAVFDQCRFHFMQEAHLWYSQDHDQRLFTADHQNRIVLSEEFFCEVTSHSIPTDLEGMSFILHLPPSSA
ncbi:MAG: replication initiator protein A [Hyphomicrobiales bacterium]|nr:replication initiator protein A [Hyphomicrobiales bacterium]